MIISLKMIDKDEFSSFQNQQFLIEEDPKSDKLYMYLLCSKPHAFGYLELVLRAYLSLYIINI